MSELQATLKGLDKVKAAYIQPPSSMEYPCIMIERSGTRSRYADNLKWHTKKVYTVTVMDRDPNSLIPDLVESLQYSSFDRFFKRDGLNHFVFQLLY